MKWPGSGPRMDLDQPLPGDEVSGTLAVSGWAFSRRAPIERIEAALGSAAPIRLVHGQPRADVAAVHGCDAACGFAGHVPLDGLPAGPVTLEVVAIDAKGGRVARQVSLVCRVTPVQPAAPGPELAPPASALIEIDEVRGLGAELEITGHALAPKGGTWRRIDVEVEGAVAAAVRHGLSRPELRGRFPDRPEAVRSGFHFRGELPAQGQVGLRAETLDGRILRRPLSRPPPQAVGLAGRELGALVRSLRDEGNREPTLLDATGLDLAAALPGELVVTPLDAATLPYVDRSFDVVAIGRDDGARLAEAHRLAVQAVVRACPEGPLELLWRAAGGTARPLPRVSVVIPVFNQSACTEACLRSVLLTWPAALAGEVIVVDDASTDDTADLLARWTARDGRVRALRQPENRGFTASCNAGAAAATGDVLVFLNNDTVPRPGWLVPLLSALDRERAGAVGGKLLYPDGTLQEAGGVIFADGDGLNFGKGDPEPDRPIYDHVREVDYCSGAVLATPRALFAELGGFDPAYAPAYYEDVDYAFRLRQHGYRVFYQPASAVVHLEGATAGRDPASGVKRHQAVNRATFVERWAKALAEQPARPPVVDRAALHRLRSRRGDTRRVLVVLPTMPEPDREGGSRRAFHLIEMLAEDRAVSVVVENANGGERYARALKQLGAATYSGAITRGAGAEYLPDLAELLTLERFDLALVAFWHLAERHLPAFRALSPRTRVLIDSVDLHFLRMARSAFGKARLEGRRDALDARFADEVRRELNAYGAADAVLAVSEKEAGWVDDLVGRAGHAFCVPLMEEPPGPAPPLEARRGLLFVANFRHPPNVDALAFLGEIVARLDPALLAEHPLAIVGNALEAGLLGPLAGHPHVQAVGWVPALEPYLERARVALVPLRHGAGTKAKLLQALVAGTPCVSTSVGIEGFGLAPDRDVLVADTAEAFAAAIARLAGDDAAWSRLSRDGRAAVVSTHGRDAVRARLRSALESVLA